MQESQQYGIPAVVHVALFMGLLVFAIALVACHRSAQRHQLSVHSDTDHEDYCIDTSQSSLALNDVKLFLGKTLAGSEHQDVNWDQADGTQNIYFVPRSLYFNDCANMPYQTYLEYRYDDTTPGGYSFVGHESVFCEPPGEEHCHYKKSVITLNTDHVDNETGLYYPGGAPIYDDLARHVINHETGHVLGLLDPMIPGTNDACWNCGIVSDEDDRCAWDCDSGYITCLFADPITGLVHWNASIMHSRAYCSQEQNSFGNRPAVNLTWPNQFDRDSVVEVINGHP